MENTQIMALFRQRSQQAATELLKNMENRSEAFPEIYCIIKKRNNCEQGSIVMDSTTLSFLHITV